MTANVTCHLPKLRGFTLLLPMHISPVLYCSHVSRSPSILILLELSRARCYKGSSLSLENEIYCSIKTSSNYSSQLLCCP